MNVAIALQSNDDMSLCVISPWTTRACFICSDGLVESMSLLPQWRCNVTSQLVEWVWSGNGSGALSRPTFCMTFRFRVRVRVRFVTIIYYILYGIIIVLCPKHWSK